MAILIYAFFKFAWAFRLSHYAAGATSPVILILARRDFFPRSPWLISDRACA